VWRTRVMAQCCREETAARRSSASVRSFRSCRLVRKSRRQRMTVCSLPMARLRAKHEPIGDSRPNLCLGNSGVRTRGTRQEAGRCTAGARQVRTAPM